MAPGPGLKGGPRGRLTLAKSWVVPGAAELQVSLALGREVPEVVPGFGTESSRECSQCDFAGSHVQVKMQNQKSTNAKWFVCTLCLHLNPPRFELMTLSAAAEDCLA